MEYKRFIFNNAFKFAISAFNPLNIKMLHTHNSEKEKIITCPFVIIYIMFLYIIYLFFCFYILYLTVKCRSSCMIYLLSGSLDGLCLYMFESACVGVDYKVPASITIMDK